MPELPQLTDARLSLQNRVAELIFQRDDVRNALTGTTLVEDILTTLDWCNKTSAVSVLILSGSGRAFSAGGDIKQMRNREGMFSGSVLQIQDQYRRGIQQLPLAMQKSEIPLIAAINGPAIGAGMDLACMCDLRVGSTSTLLGETFINLGIVSGDGGTWFLPRLIGHQRAAELLFTGRLVKAQEALELGLLLEIAEPDQLLERAHELAAQIAAKPPQAVRLSKRLLSLSQRQELPDFLEQCAAFQGMSHHSTDHLEAVDAFLEKRPGKFTGS
jgi:enoyl-CoA hydratase/carnithine racemase